MIVSDFAMLAAVFLVAAVAATGMTMTIVYFSADMSHQSKDRVQFKRTLSLFTLSIAIAAMIIVVTALTPVYIAISEMHDDAEVISGEIESVKYDKDLDIVLTVNGQDLPFEFINGTKEIGLYDDIQPYTHITPETGGMLEYTVVNYDGEEHVRASGYTQK